jgi:type IV secretory pathway TraG/TraD family ATPase VirD4
MTGKTAGFAAAAVGAVALVGWFTHPVITVVACVALALLVGWGSVWRYQHAGSATLMSRWTERSQKHHGVASAWSILRVSSTWAARRKAKVLLPGVTGRIHHSHLATRLIRVGWVWVVSTVEQHTLRFGGPRQGKSGELGTRILGPGAVLVTSTGGDLIRNTAALRARVGPVYVFNPCNIGGIKSTVSFGLLDGCEEPPVAVARATDLISGTPMGQSHRNEEWVEQANSALASLMHAAALSGKTMHHVQRWVADPDGATAEVLRHLKASPEPAMGFQALQFFNSGRPQASICMTIMPALRWLADPVATRCAEAGSFDVEKFLNEQGTIYLLAEKDGLVAPLVTVVAGHILRSARRIADRRPHERLTPGFRVVLDEAPSICPLPLPSWTSDMGKRNISMHIGAQSLSQLKARWGENGAGAILTNCGTVMVFGGTKDTAGLSTFSTLAGERHEGGNRAPLLTPAQFQQLLPLHAVVFANGILPVIGKPAMVWDRRDFKMARRTAVWSPRLAAVTGPVKTWLRRKPVPGPRRQMAALPAGSPVKAEWKPGVTVGGDRNA